MSYAPSFSEQMLNQLIPGSHHHSNNHNKNNNSLTNQNSPKRNRKAPGRKSPSNLNHQPDPASTPIIVHCHLCWDWVWQRPQQFISRLSQNHRVLFVETIGPDPQLAAPLARFKSLDDFPNITLLRLQFPAWRWNDPDFVDRERRRLVQDLISSGPLPGQFSDPIQWFYDPMAVPAFLGHMGEVLTVYDCMDELSKFACAPPQLLQREQTLLAHADVVFTGGRKLFESKSRFNPNCHFYGCGVDSDHFGKARLPDHPVAEQIAALPKPVLGYFGVVDERLDYQLLAALADANPAWSIAMVGPVLKVDEASLPRRHNLHWLGKRDYSDLPAFCKGFDICLMPFALNESTEYINPTKALEYMATARPIVSTTVPDVVSNFSSVVHIAHSHSQFIDLCAQAAHHPDPVAVKRGLRLVADNSWESIVANLERHVQSALARKRSTIGVA